MFHVPNSKIRKQILEVSKEYPFIDEVFVGQTHTILLLANVMQQITKIINLKEDGNITAEKAVNMIFEIVVRATQLMAKDMQTHPLTSDNLRQASENILQYDVDEILKELEEGE